MQTRKDTMIEPEAMNLQDTLAHVFQIDERIDNLPHLKRLGDWTIVVNHLITLVENENNLSALWVWNRFCWCFGRRDTWEASEMLTNLFEWYVDPCTAATEQYQKTPKWRWLKRRQLRQRMVDQAFNLMFAVHQLQQNDQCWSDRAAFFGYAGVDQFTEHHG